MVLRINTQTHGEREEVAARHVGRSCGRASPGRCLRRGHQRSRLIAGARSPGAMGVVKLGDSSTWKTTEHAPGATPGAAATLSSPVPARVGTVVRIPSGPSPAAPLPVPKRVMAHSGGRITVRYPAGYDPQSKSFVRGAAPAVAPAETAAEAERRRKRQERFGGSAPEAAPATCGEAVGGDDDDGYSARYAQAQAEQARLRAEFAARKRAHADAGLGVASGGVAKKRGKQSAGPQRAGVLARLSLPGDR